MTQIAGRACVGVDLLRGGEGREPYDFEASARRIGMLMAADGSDDDKIRVQGLTESLPSRTPSRTPTAAPMAARAKPVRTRTRTPT